MAVDQSLIIGPLTPEDKAEIRTILIEIGQPVESETYWNMFIDEMDTAFFEGGEWSLSGGDTTGLPNISFEDFKAKYKNS